MTTARIFFLNSGDIDFAHNLISIWDKARINSPTIGDTLNRSQSQTIDVHFQAFTFHRYRLSLFAVG
jgi:hypothetical protein